MQITNTALNNKIWHTYYVIYVIGPRASFAIPTFIGSSVLPVCKMGPGSSSAPSLMLYSEDSVTKPQSDKSTFQDGVCSFPVITCYQWIATVHLRYSSAASVFVTSQWFYYSKGEKNINCNQVIVKQDLSDVFFSQILSKVSIVRNLLVSNDLH